MLWGNDAIRKKELIDRDRHFVIRSVHPSPMAVNRLDMKTQKNFYDTKCFEEAEKQMVQHEIAPIDWTLDEYEDVKN